MKKGDKVKIIGKTRGSSFDVSYFQDDFNNQIPNSYPTIDYVADSYIDVILYTTNRGEQTWMFGHKDLILIENESYEIY